MSDSIKIEGITANIDIDWSEAEIVDDVDQWDVAVRKKSVGMPLEQILLELGYDGDIFDKMFKSARYYFRKKSTEKKEPAKRRIYVGSQKDLLEVMDDHIKSNINSAKFKPSEGFDEFCKQNVALLKEEVSILCRAGMTNSDEIKAKIKKTYKNRYFLAITPTKKKNETKLY